MLPSTQGTVLSLGLSCTGLRIYTSVGLSLFSVNALGFSMVKSRAKVSHNFSHIIC